jgi:hypothetical protein
VHVSCRYHPDELPGVSNRKGNVQSPSFIGLAEGMNAQVGSKAVYRIAGEGRRDVDVQVIL